ncbi:MAG: hypothetical protein ACR2OW_07290 [Methyloligellaceae bacterium]
MTQIKTHLILILTFGAFVFASPAHAGKSGNKYVKAYDLNGVDYVVAPVRYRRGGYEVNVPNWGWTACERSCRLTLRKFHFNNKVDALNPEKGESLLGSFTFSIPLDRY